MARPVTFNEITSAIKGVMEEIGGVGQVDLNPGGPSPWLSNGGVPAFHWWMDCHKTRQKITTIGGSAGTMSAKRDVVVVIEGWYPVISAANSHDTWRDMLDAVVLQLERKRFLGLTAGILLEFGPQVVEDGEAMKSGLYQGDTAILCHYCKIVLKYAQEYEFTTES